MSISKESEEDIIRPRLQEHELPAVAPRHIRSYPLLIGWRQEDLDQLEREGRRPFALKKNPN